MTAGFYIFTVYKKRKMMAVFYIFTVCKNDAILHCDSVDNITARFYILTVY